MLVYFFVSYVDSEIGWKSAKVAQYTIACTATWSFGGVESDFVGAFAFSVGHIGVEFLASGRIAKIWGAFCVVFNVAFDAAAYPTIVIERDIG